MRVLLLLMLFGMGNIDVLVTPDGVCRDGQSYHRITVDFKEYVKDVLPNEWYPTFDEGSLRAGAIAVKQFALHEYRTNGYVWSCNWDQVYQPGKRTDATDKAVDDTWDTWLVTEDKLYYDDYYSTCLMRGEAYCMGQHDSNEMALDGMSYDEILELFYKGEIYTPPFSRLDWNLSVLLY